LLHVLEADVAQNARIVDEDVDATEGVNGGLDDGFSILDRVVIGDGFPASGADRFNDFVCGLYGLVSCCPVVKLSKRWKGRQRRTADPWPSPLKLPPKSFTTTFAPRLPKKTAYSRPSPPPAPVTTTVWPS
jgi:hypothetical protein